MMIQKMKRKSSTIKFLGTLVVALLAGRTLFVEAAEPSKKRKKVFQVEDSIVKNPLELRDPFKKKRVKGRRSRRIYQSILVDNSYSNIPNIGPTPLESIKIVGVLLGKKRVAMAKVDKTGQVYFLREGMKIGENKSEVKAILPGGVVVVEKIRNVYDQDEYIETVIPFSGGM